MKYVIVGAGPSGLSLAYNLASNNKEVVLIEQDNQLGGSWNSQWIEDKYFSENSPRVILYNGNTKHFMKSIGLRDNDFSYVYGNAFQSTYKFTVFLMKNFTLIDFIIFFIGIVKYNLMTDKITLQTWMNQNYLSISAKKTIKIICILICDRPDKTNANDFFCSLSIGGAPKQMKEPNKWHNLIESFLINKENVTILKNTKVLKLQSSYTQDLVDTVHIQNIKDKSYSILHCDKIILCTQSNGIYPILENSSVYIRNNWMSEAKIRQWSAETFYSGFGFQLHFNEIIEFKSNWCWSCQDDWTVIILPISNWLKTYSLDPNVKTVWSCCIVDMDTNSKRLKKTANECSANEVINECMIQIHNSYNIPQPYKVTQSLGLIKVNDKWVSKNTGYTKNMYGDLEMKGKIKNLFALGCFTKKSKPNISYMGNAIDAVYNYLNIYE